MGRRRKTGFKQMKMLSSRIEEDDYYKFEIVLRSAGRKTLQETLNLVMTEMISGTLIFSGSGFGVNVNG
jgi:hypothetical protein